MSMTYQWILITLQRKRMLMLILISVVSKCWNFLIKKLSFSLVQIWLLQSSQTRISVEPFGRLRQCIVVGVGVCWDQRTILWIVQYALPLLHLEVVPITSWINSWIKCKDAIGWIHIQTSWDIHKMNNVRWRI